MFHQEASVETIKMINELQQKFIYSNFTITFCTLICKNSHSVYFRNTHNTIGVCVSQLHLICRFVVGHTSAHDAISQTRISILSSI